ncbi:MaoC family dehydratase N-terminal domain-containing protein [Myxococcota bacterium]|nr:MaoC family dehydratase N-terminal domain-containing protein [Myxococcota bacterium]
MDSNGLGSPDGHVQEGHRTVTQAAVHAFASLTGDYSRMHLDHDFARTLQGGRPIAHGLLSACWALGVLTRSSHDPLRTRDSQSGVVAFEIRFQKVVSIGDTLALRWPHPGGKAGSLSGEIEGNHSSLIFEVLNQDDEVTSRGEVTVARDQALEPAEAPPEAWPQEVWSLPDSPAIFFAEDLLHSGPRGETSGQTFTEADVLSFAREVGELNPRFLNAEFAARTAAGERLVPPMLIFCLGFAEFLQALLSAPMPDSGFAGHLGDTWRVYRPVRVGDTIICRHRPLSCKNSKSRPGQAIVEFGLQFLNQHSEVVQDGVVAMMIPTR